MNMFSKDNIAKMNANMGDFKSGFMNFIGKVGDKVNELAKGTPEDVGITYITPKVLAMVFPSSKTSLYGTSSIELPKFLNKNHNGKFMVVNLSDKSYDNKIFNDQVIEFKFPGYPAPPLDKILSICRSIHGWISADSENVIAIHCQTGRGRTLSTIACYLSWTEQFESTLKALESIGKQKRMNPSSLLIPSQLRYVSYFDKLLSKQYPKSNKLRLERIIINTIPNFIEDRPLKKGGCRPYFQIFKYGMLIFSSNSKDDPPSWSKYEDGSILVPVGIEVEGDILIRARHIGSKNSRGTMFRIGFHTGYLADGISRFNKSDIDGADRANAFDDNFFVDLVVSQTEPEVTDSEYWDTVMHRNEVGVPTERRFSLFGEEKEVDGSEDHDSFAELEKYVKGLEDGGIESGEEDLLEQIENDLAGSYESEEDLDDEVARMLAEAEDEEE